MISAIRVIISELGEERDPAKIAEQLRRHYLALSAADKEAFTSELVWEVATAAAIANARQMGRNT